MSEHDAATDRIPAATLFPAEQQLHAAVMQTLSEWGVVVDVIHPLERAVDVSTVRVEHDLYVLKMTSNLALSIAGALHAPECRDRQSLSGDRGAAGQDHQLPHPAVGWSANARYRRRQARRSAGAAAGRGTARRQAVPHSRPRRRWVLLSLTVCLAPVTARHNRGAVRRVGQIPAVGAAS